MPPSVWHPQVRARPEAAKREMQVVQMLWPSLMPKLDAYETVHAWGSGTRILTAPLLRSYG